MQIFTGLSNLSVFFVLALSSEMSLCPVAKPQLHLVSIRGSFQEELRVLTSFSHSGLSLTETRVGAHSFVRALMKSPTPCSSVRQ